MNNQLTIFASPLPFSNQQIKAHAIVGSNIQEIVDLVCPDRLKEVVDAVVFVKGKMVLPDQWADTIPAEGEIVNVRIVPGKGGGKNPITALLSIAILIAAPYAAGAILGGTLAATPALFGLTTYGNLLAGAIGMVGRLLVSALAPPPKPSNTGSANNPTESPTQFIEGAQNVLNPFGVVPVCLGVNRMFPNQCARGYTETQDNDQYVRQLFTWGWGTKINLEQFKIGETAVSEFTEIDLRHRLEGNLHEPTDLFPTDFYQEQFSVLLTEAAGFQLRTTQANINEAIVDFTLDRGLAEYNNQGKRISRNVKLELQYSPAGEDDWSPAADEFKTFSGATITETEVDLGVPVYSFSDTVAYRKDLVIIDNYTGVISVEKGTSSSPTVEGAFVPSLPTNKIRLATVTVKTIQAAYSSTKTTTIHSINDDRSSALFGVTIENNDDFEVSNTGLDLNISGGGLSVNQLDITASQTEALRRSVRIVFPEAGQYDIRARRITPDSDSDQIFDEVTLTAIKSVKYQSPVFLQGINGTAVRIKATDQLNGSLDQFNAIVSNIIPDYNAQTGLWEPRITSNPASIARYVWQGAANAKPLTDSKISLDDIEAWHVHCTAQGYSYNRVIDYEASVDDIIRDVCAAGAASPAIVDGKRTVVVDKIKEDIVQIVTPRNSWGYNAELTYPDLPHAFRVQFRNKDKGYQQDERIVYDDGYSEVNATNIEALELQSCTNASLAFKTARRHIATGRLRPESHMFMMDVEHLVALRGDRILLEHDIPIIGIGDGRIKEVFYTGDSPELISGFSIDDTVTVPSSSTYYVRVRLKDGSFLYKEVNTVVGEMTSFEFTTPFPQADMPNLEGDLCYFVEAGGEVDLVITKIEPQEDLSARITAVNYAPEIFVAENATIPAFQSKITTPLEFIRPSPPILVGIQSDESVMLRQSDGSILSRMVITLNNPNEGEVITSIRLRRNGSTVFTNANVLETTATRVILTGLDDGSNYDIQIRYSRPGGSVQSLPLIINNYKFLGATGTPSDVTNFNITAINDAALFKWDKSPDIDHSHYKMKFTSAVEGATWLTAQTLEETILDNRLTTPLQTGTYLIKDVDILGNESANAKLIVVENAGILKNVVATLQEHPSFAGVKDNVKKIGSIITLNDPAQVGYYYFDNDIDLDDIFISRLTANVRAFGTFTNNLFDIEDLFASEDVFGGGQNDIFSVADIFNMGDVFGIGEGKWAVQLQYRTTDTNPADSPGGWAEWREFITGESSFRSAQFRLKMESFEDNITPAVNLLSVTVDMPDRIERGKDITIPVSGYYVDYGDDFRVEPAIAPFVQDLLETDKIEISLKTTSGFFIRVYNTVVAGYVSRTFDYIVSGYGRKA